MHSSLCFCQHSTCIDHSTSPNHISSSHCLVTYFVSVAEIDISELVVLNPRTPWSSLILTCFRNAMAPSLRGRLVCFYCGSKSDRTRTANIRSWQCKKCEAVNHLDEVRLLAISYLFCSLADKILYRMAKSRTLLLHQSPLPRLATLNQSNDQPTLSTTFRTIPSSARHAQRINTSTLNHWLPTSPLQMRPTTLNMRGHIPSFNGASRSAIPRSVKTANRGLGHASTKQLMRRKQIT